MLPLEYSEEDNRIDDEDWEDEEYEEYEEDPLVETASVKKKGGRGVVTVFILFLVLIGGLGGGYYYISIPQGEALRAKIPANILSMIPLPPIGNNVEIAVDDTPKQQVSNLPPITPIASDGFSAPPMPAMGEESFDDKPAIFADDTVPAIDTATPVIDFSEDENNPFVQSPSSETVVDTPQITEMANDYQNNAPDLNVTTMSDKIKPESLIDVEDRLLSLEKAILSIEKDMIKRSELLTMNTQMQLELKALRADIKKIISSPNRSKKVVKSHKAISPVKNNTAKHSVSKRHVKHVKKVEWVLQSAQPGKARIAEKGKNNGRNISVGDSVKGLGKIISVEQDGNTGYWVVKGSQGSVQQ